MFLLLVAAVAIVAVASQTGGDGDEEVEFPVETVALDDSLTFIVLGDWGRQGCCHQRDVARQMARYAGPNNVSFVMTTGDNFYETGIVSPHDSLVDESWTSVYLDEADGGAGLSVPWHIALGNHDHKSPFMSSEIELSSVHDLWRCPARYYTMAKRLPTPPGSSSSSPSAVEDVSACFVVADTSPMLSNYPTYGNSNEAYMDRENQADWVRETVASTGADPQCKWTFVVAHHALYSGGAPSHSLVAELRALFEEAFATAGVDAMFGGHEHNLQHLRAGNIDYLVSGGGSKVEGPMDTIPEALFQRLAAGFLVVSVTPRTASYSFVSHMGEVMYTVRRTV